MKVIEWIKNHIELIGWIAFSTGFLTFLSQIDQIRLNLSGHPGSVLMGIALTINSFSWLLYGIGKNSKQLIFANFIGILIGISMAITSFD